MSYKADLEKVMDDFFKTLFAAWQYFEGDEENPYPFDLWLEDLRESLADLDNDIYNTF